MTSPFIQIHTLTSYPAALLNRDDQGFAKRYVHARMSQHRPGQLWVHWRTDFVDPGRADYEKDEWFRRA